VTNEFWGRKLYVEQLGLLGACSHRGLLSRNLTGSRRDTLASVFLVMGFVFMVPFNLVVLNLVIGFALLKISALAMELQQATT
jgi:hypothetical protein